MLSDTQIAAFKSSLRGQLITPADPQYDEARKVYNGMIDRRPGLIAQCADVADVMTAVNFAREQKLLVVDSRRWPQRRRPRRLRRRPGDRSVADAVRARRSEEEDDSGWRRTLWGDVDHATHAFGLAVPAGIISTTGVGGLTLGGGIGHLTRRCGLTHRQPARSGHGARRRPLRHRERERRTRISSGPSAAAAATSAS